jgi:hypothetical protein
MRSWRRGKGSRKGRGNEQVALVGGEIDERWKGWVEKLMEDVLRRRGGSGTCWMRDAEGRGR